MELEQPSAAQRPQQWAGDEKKACQVILCWESLSGSPCASPAFPPAGERTTLGVTFIPRMWGFNCKLSRADTDALQMAECLCLLLLT